MRSVIKKGRQLQQELVKKTILQLYKSVVYTELHTDAWMCSGDVPT